MTGFEYIIKTDEGMDCEKADEISREAMIYTADINLETGSKSINAKSYMALKELDLSQGDKITVTAEGDDERIAVYYLKKLLEKEL
jgi:phosphotransferase system HPr (HPr) family protein